MRGWGRSNHFRFIRQFGHLNFPGRSEIEGLLNRMIVGRPHNETGLTQLPFIGAGVHCDAIRTEPHAIGFPSQRTVPVRECLGAQRIAPIQAIEPEERLNPNMIP